MAWKPKEKPLTPEEAIALARRELAPFWFGSAPLMASVPTPAGGFTARPLDPVMGTQPWLILFLDPTSFAGGEALALLETWYRRYRRHGLSMLAAFVSPYPSFYHEYSISQLLKRQGYEFPICTDVGLARAFHAEKLPRLFLLNQGKVHLSAEGETWFDGTELKIQRFLRESDPGLPLPPAVEPERPSARDVSRLELGSPQADPPRSVSLPLERPASLKPGELRFGGTWTQSRERVETSDPHAFLAFRAPSSRVSIAGQSMAKSIDPARIAVEVDGVAAFEAFGGENLIASDTGHSVVEMQAASLYHALAQLPAGNREITLRFPGAEVVPVGIYGIRFGE